MDNIIVTNRTLISVIDATYDVARQISLDKPPKVCNVSNIFNISETNGTGTIYAYSNRIFGCCPIKISWNRNTDEIFIGIYSADNKLITINRNNIQIDTKPLERAGFMVSSAFQKLYNTLKFGVFANIYRKIYSGEMKMNNNEEKKESKIISQIELYDIMNEYMKPTIKKNVEEGGRFSYCPGAGTFYWYCINTSSKANIGAYFEKGRWKIWTNLRDNVNITMDDNIICFNTRSKFDDFSEEFMRGLYDKLKDYFSDSHYSVYCDTLTKAIEKAVTDPNGWESVKRETLHPTYCYNQYGKLEPVIDPFVCAKINNDIKDNKSETENDEKEIETINLLPIKKVFFNKTKKTTTVVFKDTNNNDKVVVSKTSPRDKYDPEMGLAMCIAKEYFGNRNKLAKFVEEWLKENEPKNKQIARDERRKKLAKKKKEKAENAETDKTNESKDLKETKSASKNNKTKSKTKRFCDECNCPPNNEEEDK